MMVIEDKCLGFDSFYSFMAKSYVEDKDDEEESFLDIQKNLKSYSLNELRSLASVLIDAYCDLTKEKEPLNDDLVEFENEKSVLFVQIVELEGKVTLLSYENNTLNDKLKVIPRADPKKKGKGSDLQFELETKLNKSKLNLIASLERNKELERDLVRIKADFKKSLCRAASLETLAYLGKIRTNIGSRLRKGVKNMLRHKRTQGGLFSHPER